ncbi:hypothetical protein [Fusobacterium ulcerans]|uniref:hypothetical protein n=1 Tax=Fusobacterium ulcerans TaxID=861 RepID=UPI001D0AA6F6|nr:hypothetical protein [Fusobacterium ulcerans]MCB8564474.1 hypothetical protein [Fusobacterium ulcerans]MCB8648645.1 hypothetical protein [Fusobacterium ulcerans]
MKRKTERYVTLGNRERKMNEEDLKKYEKGNQIYLDGIFYKVIESRLSEGKLTLKLESLEGRELFEAKERNKFPYMNIPAYLREINEEGIWIDRIVPVVAGEEFEDMFLNDILENSSYEIDEIDYPEEYEERIKYFEAEKEVNFSIYKWLVIVRKGNIGNYSYWIQAYTDINNLDLKYKKKGLKNEK